MRFIAISWFSTDHGFPVLIVNYRYTSLSFPNNVNPKDPKQRKEAIIAAKDIMFSMDWVEDVRAGLQLLRERFPGRGISYLGNSAGGTSAYSLPSRVCFKSSLFSGWLLPLAKTPGDTLLRALFLSVSCPSSPKKQLKKLEGALKLTEKLGYFPSAKLGLGSEDLPASYGVEWVCTYPCFVHYILIESKLIIDRWAG